MKLVQDSKVKYNPALTFVIVLLVSKMDKVSQESGYFIFFLSI